MPVAGAARDAGWRHQVGALRHRHPRRVRRRSRRPERCRRRRQPAQRRRAATPPSAPAARRWPGSRRRPRRKPSQVAADRIGRAGGSGSAGWFVISHRVDPRRPGRVVGVRPNRARSSMSTGGPCATPRPAAVPLIFEEEPELLPVLIENAVAVGGAVRVPGGLSGRRRRCRARDLAAVAQGLIPNHRRPVTLDVSHGALICSASRRPTAKRCWRRPASRAGDDLRFNAAAAAVRERRRVADRRGRPALASTRSAAASICRNCSPAPAA